MSSESDALVLVVSEETGTIALADAGKLVRYLSLDDLGEELNERLSPTRSRQGGTARNLSDLWRYVRRFLVVAPLALVIWFLADQASLTQSDDVRVAVRVRHDNDRAVRLLSPEDGVLELKVRGSKRRVDKLVATTALQPLRVNWRLEEPYHQPNQYSPEQVELIEIIRSTTEFKDYDVIIAEVTPPTLVFEVEEVLEFTEIPIEVIARDRQLVVDEVSTPTVTVRLRASQLEALGGSISSLPLDLSERVRSLGAGDRQRFDGLVLPTRIDGVELVEVDPRMVNVDVRIVAEQTRRRLERIPVQLSVSPQVLEQVTPRRQDRNEWLVSIDVEGDKRTIDALDPARIRGSVSIALSDAIVGPDFKAFAVDIPLPEGVRLLGAAPTVHLRFENAETTP